MRRPFTQMRPIGPLFASDNGEERLQSIESDLQTLADLISEDFDTEAPTVKVWIEDVWIQIARQDAMGNYDNFRKQINMKERKIEYNIFIHEYAHHLINNSEDISMAALEVDKSSMETINEVQAESIAKNVVDKQKFRRNWNQLLAMGYGDVTKV